MTPTNRKWCPDCGREGCDGWRPIEEFYRTATYCKHHANLRATASRRKALADPDPTNAARLRKRAEARRYRLAHKELSAARTGAWKRANKERVAGYPKQPKPPLSEEQRERQRAYNRAYYLKRKAARKQPAPMRAPQAGEPDSS